MEMSFACFDQGIPLTRTIYDDHSNIEAGGTNVNFFSYDVVLAENRTHQPPDAERMRHVLRHS